MPGVRVAAFGDSITATTNDYTNNSLSDSWFTYMILSSGGRLRYAGNYAQGGTTSTQILAQMRSVLANQYLTQPFDVAFIKAGVNDNLDGSNLPNPTVANIKAMVAECQKRGIRPVLCTLVPSGLTAPMGAPTYAPTVVATTGGGTLAAGTYYYAYTRLNTGESTIGPASTAATLASAGNVVVTLPADKGATYNIYRSTTGGAGTWTKVATLGFVTTSSWVPTQSWTDTGAAAGAAPPSTDGTGASIGTTARLKLATISRWVRRYAALNGIDCIDFSTFSDGYGQWATYASKDGTHPTPQSSRKMGQFAWNSVGSRFPLVPGQLATDSGDTLNLVPNGCFRNLNGSNLPQQWGGYGGSGTPTLVAAPKTGFVGNAYSITRSDSTPWYDGSGGVSTAWSVGDRIAFGFMIQTEGVEASNAIVSMGLKLTGNTQAPNFIGTIGIGGDIGPAVWVCEETIPPGTTGIAVAYSISNAGNVGASAPSAKVSVGQVTAYNLTTGQFLVP
jgi:lysophospholipase L1-like esterase